MAVKVSTKAQRDEYVASCKQPPAVLPPRGATCAHPDWYDPDLPNVCPWCALDRVRALCDEGRPFVVTRRLRAALDAPVE